MTPAIVWLYGVISWSWQWVVPWGSNFPISLGRSLALPVVYEVHIGGPRIGLRALIT